MLLSMVVEVKRFSGLIRRLRPISGRCPFRGLFALNSLVYFFPVHCDVFGCIDPNSDLISLDPQNGDCDIAPNHDRFTSASRQNQPTPALRGSKPRSFCASNFLNCCNNS